MGLWGGRFMKTMDDRFKKFNNSLHFDYKLVKEDIFSSIAWSKALFSAGVLCAKEQEKIEIALNSILSDASSNSEGISRSNFEDIHTWVEKKLIDKIGVLGKKLHTGRSRNDQVTTDLKLWCKAKSEVVFFSIQNLQKILVITAEKNQDVIMPGYTHLQSAQPITFSHWCLAYVEKLKRDESRLSDSLKRIDVSPLGSGALAGSAYPIDREQLAKYLGFSHVSHNSLDAVSDRDYVLEFLFNAAISMINLSRFSEDMIFFNTSKYIEFSDRVTSGSSLMPQKKNPDALELIRGKCGRVLGALVNIVIMLKGLPLAYNKDMQEDKESLFDAIETWLSCLEISSLVLDELQINPLNCRKAAENDYINSTDLADYLVSKGISFREAHEIVGKIVLNAIKEGVLLEDFSLTKFKEFSVLIEDDIYSNLSLQSCLNKRDVIGGVAFNQVVCRIKEEKKRLLLI